MSTRLWGPALMDLSTVVKNLGPALILVEGTGTSVLYPTSMDLGMAARVSSVA